MRSANRDTGILFINVAPGRNGAPMMLLHFLRSLKTNGNRPFSILLSGKGELASEFAAVANTWVATNSHWCPGGLRSQIARAVGMPGFANAAERADLRRFAASCRPGLIYLNGFHNASFRLIEVLDLNVPLLTHVHELGLLFRAQGASVINQMLARTKKFIACSDAVRRNLIGQHAVDPARIEVVYESISVADIHGQRPREEVLHELGFPRDAVVIIGCGTAAWNKGTDIFVRLAQLVCKQRELARFVWVGNGIGWEVPQHEHDVAMMGLSDKVRFTGQVRSPADYISAADVFLLSSREDSFPLVCLEAAALSKPIVCFADGGGMPEFIEEDAGVVVPYLDSEAMASRLISLIDSPECRRKLGNMARQKVAERHDVSKATPRILSIIETTMAAI